MTSCLDITRAVNPPRATFLNFPLGHTTGKPDEPEMQREIIVEALQGFVAMTRPGWIKILPFEWSKDETWNRAAMREGDRRVARYDTPQYDSDEDRRLAEERAAKGDECHVCASFSGAK